MPICAWRIFPKTDPRAPKVLVIGGHHAREWIAVEVPFRIGERLVLLANHATIKPVQDKFEIWIVPVLNPEGNE